MNTIAVLSIIISLGPIYRKQIYNQTGISARCLALIRMTKAVNRVIIDHTHCLHKGVADGWPDKGKAPFFEIFAHGFGFGSLRRDVTQVLAMVDERSAADKAPDVGVKAAKLLLDRQKRTRIFDHTRHFEFIAHNAGVGQQSRDFGFVVLCNRGGVEVVKGRPVIFPLAQDRDPTQPRLCPL